MTVTALASAALAVTTPLAGDSGPIERIESSLMPTMVLEGQPVPSWTLGDRMSHYRVPGVAVAVIREGEIAWSKGYGVVETGGSRPVTAETLFQAASISKPVSAAGALKLVEAGTLNLDEDVNRRLRTWKVPSGPLTEVRPVTLGGLLSHTAGMTVHGFPGYPADQPVPSVVDVLEGRGNTDPIRVDVEPGSQWRYSGGGFTVAQLLITDAAGKPFPELMKQLVLEPAGMAASTYQQPLPEPLEQRAAVGHRSSGEPVAGRWHTYPEMAAAGLWTTPAELGRFAIAVWRSYRSEPGSLLSADTAEQMLTEVMNGYGLGMSLRGEGPARRFGHGGANEGYRCQMLMYLDSGDGVVVMTNSDRGDAVSGELLRAVAVEYGWPGFEPEVKTLAKLRPEALPRLAGRYQVSEQFVVSVEVREDRLAVTVPGLGVLEMLPESEEHFFSLEPGIPEIDFVFEDGRVTGLRGAGQLGKKIE
jgi:CubicO group peptidase (beta-lactamase class C family)